MQSRRGAALAFIAAAVAATLGTPARAADKVIKVGMDLTRAASEGALRVGNGIMMAIDAASEGKGMVTRVAPQC
jgi:hypothetical protein